MKMSKIGTRSRRSSALDRRLGADAVLLWFHSGDANKYITYTFR